VRSQDERGDVQAPALKPTSLRGYKGATLYEGAQTLCVRELEGADDLPFVMATGGEAGAGENDALVDTGGGA
jgi:hypothetical protein